MTNPVEMKFLNTKIEVVLKSVGEMIREIEEKKVIVDPEVQRKLDRKRTVEIAWYIINALKGKTFGAYFAPILSSKRKSGVYAILDGQHRFFGGWKAIDILKKEIEWLSDISEQYTVQSDLQSVQEQPERNILFILGEATEIKDQAELQSIREQLEEYILIILNSVIPMMAYVGLTKDQEQQAFHDTNNKGKKVSQDLTLSFNHSDPLVNLTRTVCEYENVKPFIQPLNTKKDKEKLFSFKGMYTTVSTFLGKTEEFSSVDPEELGNDLYDFFSIVTDSLPEDAVTGEYLYRHAGILPGIALFAYRMKKTEGVCWQNTLKNALSNVSFSNTNTQFVRHGRALLGADKKVTFTGSKGAISAVLKTLEKESLRLDQEGNEVFEAYHNAEDLEPVVIVSDEVAATVEEELIQTVVNEKASVESGINHPTQAESFSASQKAILNAIDESEDKTISGSYTQLADMLNFARSTTTDALKKLEAQGFIVIEDDNGIKTVKRT